MNVAVALVDVTQGSRSRVPRSVLLRTSDGVSSSLPSHSSYGECKVVTNDAGLVCAFDSLRALVFRYNHEDNQLLPIGCFFFRQNEEYVQLSCIEKGGIFDYLEGVQAGPPERSTNTDIVFTAESLIAGVELFTSSLTIGSKTGHLALVNLTADPSEGSAQGFYTRIREEPEATDYEWGTTHLWAFVKSKAMCIAMTSSGITVWKDVQTSPDHQHFPGVIQVQELSCAAASCHDSSGAVTVVACFSSRHSIFVFRCNVNGGSTKQGFSRCEISLTSQPLNLVVFATPRLQACVECFDGVLLAALVYPDGVFFCTLQEDKVVVFAAIPNDVSLALCGGCWLGAAPGTRKSSRFAVFRVDSTCAVYEIEVDRGSRAQISDIRPWDQFSTPFPSCGVMSVGNTKGILLSMQGTEALEGGCAGCAQVQTLHDAGSFFQPLTVVTPGLARTSSVVWLEVVTLGGACGFFALMSSGECYVVMYETPGQKQLVATVEDASAVSSCLVLLVNVRIQCILGFQNGDVSVFLEGKHKVTVFSAHCGCVDSLFVVPQDSSHYIAGGGGGSANDGAGVTSFVSVSTQLGAVCVHLGEQAEIVRTLSSPTQPLTRCFFDATREYMFVFSGVIGNLWHLPTCFLERTVEWPKQLDALSRYTVSEPDGNFRVDEKRCDNDILYGDAVAPATAYRSSLQIQRVQFNGVSYFGVCVDADRLIADLRIAAITDLSTPGTGASMGGAHSGLADGSEGGGTLPLLSSSDYQSALSLLLHCCEEPHTALPFCSATVNEALQCLSLDVAPAHPISSASSTFSSGSNFTVRCGSAARLTAAAALAALSDATTSGATATAATAMCSRLLRSAVEQCIGCGTGCLRCALCTVYFVGSGVLRPQTTSARWRLRRVLALVPSMAEVLAGFMDECEGQARKFDDRSTAALTEGNVCHGGDCGANAGQWWRCFRGAGRHAKQLSCTREAAVAMVLSMAGTYSGDIPCPDRSDGSSSGGIASVSAATTPTPRKADADVLVKVSRWLQLKILASVRAVVSDVQSEAVLSTATRTMLTGLTEGFQYVRHMPEAAGFVDALAKAAFGGKDAGATGTDYRGVDGATSTVCLNALKVIVSIDVPSFMKDFFARYYSTCRTWRPSLLLFLADLVREHSDAVYPALILVMEYLLNALDPHNPDKRERELCVAAATQLTRCAVAHFPNVSFQQHLQHLAVGFVDGTVNVYSLKTTALIASVKSGVGSSRGGSSEPIVAVAYSANNTSHDIAIVSAGMKEIRVWQAARSTGAFASFFTGTTLQFKATTSVDLPPVLADDDDLDQEERHMLLLRCCTLKWLSPHCVQLTSPWHGSMQVTLPAV